MAKSLFAITYKKVRLRVDKMYSYSILYSAIDVLHNF